MWACEYGLLDVAELLLDNHAKIDLQDSFGLTALMSASVHGLTTVVELLLDRERRWTSRWSCRR